MTILEDVLNNLEKLGGEAHLDDIYRVIPNIKKASIRHCLEKHSSDSAYYREDNPDLFYSKHGVQSRQGIWGLRNNNQNNSYESIVIDYLKANGKSTIDELYDYIKDFKITGKTGKRYLREVVTNRYKGLDVFVYENPYVWLKEPVDTSKQIEEHYEGELTERNFLSRKRNQKVIKQVKERDQYTCRACNFSYNKSIVQAHHLTPISEKGEGVISPENIITLCPNCHTIAHKLLKNNSNYADKQTLISKLVEISSSQ